MIASIGTNILMAAQLLQQNKLVAIPTETVYGLAANALNAEAVTKIFEAKQRPFFNPLIIHLASVNDIEKYAYVNELALKLAQQFMPGAFTLLLPKKNIVPDIVTAGSAKVAIRIPNHALTLQLLQQLSFPLAAPSANVFGYVSPVTASHVAQGLQHTIDYILDGGTCSVGVESTIVEVQDNNEVLLHRVGGVSVEAIESFIGKKLTQVTKQNQPQTSGQLKSHYATHTPLLQGNVDDLMKEYKDKKMAVICLGKKYYNASNVDVYSLSEDSDLSQAAANLFTTLRCLDEKTYDIILAEVFPAEGLGLAINDRLQRAQFIHK